MGKYFFMRNFRRIALATLLAGLFALPLEAEGTFSRMSWFVEGSLLFFPEDNGMESDPMPILPALGAGVSYPLGRRLALELTLDFYTTHYGYSHTLNRPVPLAIENRTARVMGFLLGLQLAGHFELTPRLRIRAYGGPAADLRIALIASGLNEGLDDMDEIRRDTNLVRSYFWSRGRWFKPLVGVGADYTLNSGFRLGVDFRVWMPVYRLWTGENLPPVEGWRFGPGIRLTIP